VVARAQPQGFFALDYGGVGFTQMQQCPAKLPNCGKIVGVERKRGLMLHPRLAQATTLDSA
jgi:hypothetical protein